MHKNTLKKPKFQYTLTLCHPQDKKNTILSSYAAARLLGIISIANSHLFAAYHKVHIYTCYFIKSAPGIPNTTCIRSISMTGLGLVGPYGLVAKFKPH